MTATMGPPEHTFIDPITLAAMSDTGWYHVNYNSTQPLVWGRAQGGGFGLTSACQDNSSKYFCTGSGLGCHYLHMDKASCLTDEFLDGCRVYKPLVNGSECWKEKNGQKAGNLSASGEIYGEWSRCFFANLTRAAPSSSSDTEVPMTGHCYLHRCVGENAFEVKVQGSAWLRCKAGDSIQVPGFRGLLFCPDGRLCRHGEDRTTAATARPPIPTVSRSTPLPPPPPPAVPNQPAQPEDQAGVRIGVRASPECQGMEERDARGVAESLLNVTDIPRCHIQNPHVCSGYELCLELWEYSGCSNHSITSLYWRLEEIISAGRLQLRVAGKNCTAISIRSASGPSSLPPPEAEGQKMPGTAAVAVCGALGVAVVGGALGVGVYHKLRGGRGRVHHAGSWRLA
ncbi:leishmanolysin-like peptidase 2 [Carcharodon carcharias]|uniref:leishmanolysin-like peptidase 2 n=1 Tax=Carcharodon carcharias TaxID=13397 RepID=UPI001B7DB8DF|nr:leishmanolysin-like peptidase 2 [Carcharodon carcharias]